MAQTPIRGTQIMIGTIPLSALVAGYSIPTANLADGANFLKRDGSIAATANLNAGGFKITNGIGGTLGSDFVVFSQLQSAVNGLGTRRTRVVAVTNIALTGLQTIDSVALVANDYVLLTAQSTGAQKGLWLAQSGAWTRPTDWAAASTQKSTAFLVEEGTVYGDTKWMAISDAITVDTTNVVITQDLTGGTYTAGNGILLTGSAFSTKLGIGLEFDGGNNIQIKRDGTSLANSATGLKITPGTPGQIIIGTTTTGEAVFTTVSGDVVVSSTGVTTVNTTAGAGFVKYTNIVTNETPTGAVNSANTSFTLASTPLAGSLSLYINGILMESGVGNDYTLAGTTITMLWTPITGDKLRANYVK